MEGCFFVIFDMEWIVEAGCLLESNPLVWRIFVNPTSYNKYFVVSAGSFRS